MEKEARQLPIGVLGCGPIAQAAHFVAISRSVETGAWMSLANVTGGV